MRNHGRPRGGEVGAFIVDGRGTVLGLDEAMESLTGWPAIDVVGRPKDLGRPGRPKDQDTPSPYGLYEGELSVPSRPRQVPLRLHCRNGNTLEVEAAISRLPGPGDRIQVTALRILSSSPVRRSSRPDQRDPLTGLPMPDAFAAHLANEFHEATASAQPLAVVLLDVDHLREINDRFGHDVGDEVLRRLAGILRVSVEDDDLVCRLGDDDFAILLPRSGRGEARHLAASLRSTVERYRFFGEGKSTAEVTLSLGAASFPADAETGADLMDRAREALDEARAMGRNRVWCYLRKPRVPVEVPVYFDAAEASLVGYTRDLSPSGIFVQTAVPIDVGMRCALAFPLPGKDGRVHVIGRVVRTVPPDLSSETGAVRIPGMGVEFEQFSGSNDRRSIDAFLHDNESMTLRPESGPLSIG